MSETKQFAEQIIRTLRDHNHQAYLVGGCVRDVLLDLEPTDYDVTTDATPDQVMRIFPETYAVGAQFGVVLVPVRDDTNSMVEVATFRSDIGYSDGRHPDQVRFSKSAQEDVERRDFTINGLLFDPVKNEFLDFVGGRKDLEAGSFELSDQPTFASPKTNCGCCAPCALPLASDTRSSPKPLPQFRNLRQGSIKSLVNVSATN